MSVRNAARGSYAWALVCVLMWGASAHAENPPAGPATDPLADPDAESEAKAEAEPVVEDAPPADAPAEVQAPPSEPPAAPQTPAPAPSHEQTTQQPEPASGASNSTTGPAAAPAGESEEISYDKELADFVASGAGVGSRYDRAYATTADEKIRATADDDSADLYEVEGRKHEHGFGVQVRHTRLSKRMQEIFVERSAGPASQNGFGLSYLNRTQAVAFSVGLGYDPLDGVDGYYVERGGKATAAGDVDYVDFRDLAWVTLDVNAIGVVDLHEAFAFRFGAGLGAGVLLGQIRKTDALCTSDRVDSDCAPDPNGAQMDEEANIPPVLPVINALAGFQGRPSKNIAINLDVGIHSIPYVALGVEAYLW